MKVKILLILAMAMILATVGCIGAPKPTISHTLINRSGLNRSETIVRYHPEMSGIADGMDYGCRSYDGIVKSVELKYNTHNTIIFADNLILSAHGTERFAWKLNRINYLYGCMMARTFRLRVVIN
ncbi:hypothetical protein LCGC14_0926690 [marine sediment metagenome]|uniref:Uncharacterized protein n=1 Tax=marine sediment metagenome TaxID=412755 RepID=A0A0F9PA51_9ZZZZ